MSATVSPVVFFSSILSKIIALKALTEYKSLVLKTVCLAKSSYVTTNNILLYESLNKLLHPCQMFKRKSTR